MKNISQYRHWIFIAIFWFVLGFAIWAQSVQDLNITSAIFQTILVIASSVLVAHTLSDILLPKALASGKMNLFVIQSAFMVLLLSVIHTSIFISFEVPGFRPDALSKLSFAEYVWFRIYTSIPAALLINATACGLRFYQEHSVIEKKHALLKQSHLEAQIKILQDQINPHLMFNVLNHIHILMQRNVDLASELLIKFSDILRYQLYECNREYVLLEREIKYLKDLIGVEQIRWGNELDVDCKWEIQNGSLQIAPLLLMPLVENAFKHVSRLPHEKGYVYLLCKQEQNNLTLKIENSYTEQYKIITNNHGLGLENVRKRLSIQYPDHYNLIIEKTENKFTIILTLVLN
ncbi:Sensor histidine kinase YehU [compost metagenome]